MYNHTSTPFDMYVQRLRTTRRQFELQGEYRFYCVVVAPWLLQTIRNTFIADGTPRTLTPPVATDTSDIQHQHAVTLFDSVEYEAQQQAMQVPVPAVEASVADGVSAPVSTNTSTRQNVLDRAWACVQSASSMTITLASMLLTILSIGVAVSVFAPQLYYAVAGADVITIPNRFETSVDGTSYSQGTAATRDQLPEEHITEAERYLPPQNDALPEGEWLNIPRIGVYTPLRATENPADALTEGVWMDPSFGAVGSLDQPVILAAHRFGYKWWWQSDYWKSHSFYNLPELEAGDRISLISDQRRYVYEIYKAEEGDEITDYDADLILYTCKFLNSPVRHVRYARLLEPTS